MNYAVLLMRQAELDIQTIYDWLSKRSPAGALRWYDALDNALYRLKDEATIWSEAPESAAFPDTIRQCLFKTKRGRTYRILFTIVGQQVRVLHVRGPGQEFVQY